MLGKLEEYLQNEGFVIYETSFEKVETCPPLKMGNFFTFIKQKIEKGEDHSIFTYLINV